LCLDVKDPATRPVLTDHEHIASDARRRLECMLFCEGYNECRKAGLKKFEIISAG
jgi:hypothetical protein